MHPGWPRQDGMTRVPGVKPAGPSQKELLNQSTVINRKQTVMNLVISEAHLSANQQALRFRFRKIDAKGPSTIDGQGNGGPNHQILTQKAIFDATLQSWLTRW